MKTTQPTPSQAAVVLKNYLSEHGIPFKLGHAQEAIARINGYANWNSLTSDQPARGKSKGKPTLAVETATHSAHAAYAGKCRKCASMLAGGYCSDKTCPYSDWPQFVEYGTLSFTPTARVEELYGIEKRKNDELLLEPSIEALEDASSEMEDTDEALSELFDKLERALLATGMLNDWRRQHGRDERADEGHSPYLQVSFDRRLSDRFVTELVFTLRDHSLQCYVRTWEIRDGLDHSRDCGIFDEQSGDYDTDAKKPDEEAPISDLVAAALEEADFHKSRLVERVNVR